MLTASWNCRSRSRPPLARERERHSSCSTLHVEEALRAGVRPPWCGGGWARCYFNKRNREKEIWQFDKRQREWVSEKRLHWSRDEDEESNLVGSDGFNLLCACPTQRRIIEAITLCCCCCSLVPRLLKSRFFIIIWQTGEWRVPMGESWTRTYNIIRPSDFVTSSCPRHGTYLTWRVLSPYIFLFVIKHSYSIKYYHFIGFFF